MKVLALSICLLTIIADCFKVYVKDQKILSSNLVKSKEQNETKRAYFLTYTVLKNELKLTLDCFFIEEKKQIQTIQEVIQDVKDFEVVKYPTNSIELGILFVVGSVELIGLPSRLHSYPYLRYKEIIKKLEEKKLEKISTDDTTIQFTKRIKAKSYDFVDGNVSIPLEEIFITSGNYDKLVYLLKNKETNIKLQSGKIDITSHLENNFLSTQIKTNNRKPNQFLNSTSENGFYDVEPFCNLYSDIEIETKSYGDLFHTIDQYCLRKFPNSAKYNECVGNFKNCYTQIMN
ncbi:MAG: hypothetical protein SFU98_00500 [Leptospiraceae bacterium]|nr:hypothetical protein [Leptospiraceae bacterium]